MKNVKKAALALAAAGALIAGAAGTANAASYNGSCESAGGEICLYRLADFTGGLYDTIYSKTNYNGSTYYGTSTLIDNTVSSVRNRDSVNAIDVYTGQNYTGTRTHADPGLTLWDMAVWDDDNEISSHCFENNAYCPG
ncbi:peptidase inhibitor family I36 protein [Streptomyces sp. NBC_01353]|uniref:peptidase inhibitor family I36 protein n=1 Tax=Streptomyces sp. NBC_01353 TaxID=2903835 RepID=UPI002E3588A5|nr:peptidase inhibitor family I36 protein [Streptomyces sp. NBC_01353]